MGSAVLLCFDGSEGAETAIVRAGKLLGPRRAMVLTVCEPAETWEAYDPATIIDAGIAKVTPAERELAEIDHEHAAKTAAKGVELARAAGFEADGRVEDGKTWEAICEVADPRLTPSRFQRLLHHALAQVSQPDQ